MQFGIAIPTAADSWCLVRRAEELGFSHAWFFDTQMLSADPFVAMAAAAMKTTRIKLGTGVLIPSNRIAPVAANAFASLNKLAPGRIVFGISTGFTGRRTMGLGAVKLADMEEYIRVVQALWRGETVEMELEGKRRPIRLLNPELGLINLHDPIPLFIAASGPRARKLTAKLGAGWIDNVADVERGTATLEQMRAAWQEAGHARDELQAVAWIGGAVLEEGEPVDGPRGMALAAVASRGGHRAGRLSGAAGDAAGVCRGGRGLCRARAQLRAGERVLSLQSSRPSDVRASRRTPLHHRGDDPQDVVHRHRHRPHAAHRRAGGGRFHSGGVLHPARAGACDRGLGTHPPGLPLTSETSYRSHTMPGQLADKTAFVTAAGQGIGRATALAFAAAGARVIATDIDAAKVQAIASDRIRPSRLDVLRADDIAQAARDAGAIDILFNCAGFVHQGALLDAMEDEWTLAFDLNVRSMFRTMRAFVPGMVTRGNGVILNMASVSSSLKGVPNRFIYTATKAAVIGMTKSVATDYIRHGIRCNCLCPGTVLTPSLEERIAENAAQAGSVEAARQAFVDRQPMGRLGTPEEIAELAVYLASDAAQFITGQAVVIDGGLTL